MAPCVISGCDNEPGLRYFRFPKEEFFRKKWLDACGKRHAIFYKSPKICSKHFEMSAYKICTGRTRTSRCLRDDAIPTLNLPFKTSDPSNGKASLYSYGQGSYAVSDNNSHSNILQRKRKKLRSNFNGDILQKIESHIPRLHIYTLQNDTSMQIKEEELSEDGSLIKIENEEVNDVDDESINYENNLATYDSDNSRDEDSECGEDVCTLLLGNICDSLCLLQSKFVTSEAILRRVESRLRNIKNREEWNSFLSPKRNINEGSPSIPEIIKKKKLWHQHRLKSG